MALSTDELFRRLRALSPQTRYELAQQLLDSIAEEAAAELDHDFMVELRRRRDEMLREEEIIGDWRAALAK